MTPRQQLLRSVGGRVYGVALASRVRWGVVGTASALLLGIAASRLLGIIPAESLRSALLLLLSCVPVALALATARPLPSDQLARLIDSRTGSKDLFLTATLDPTPAAEGFGGIVRLKADARAAEIKAVTVVPYRWQRGLLDVLASIALVAAAFWGLPQLDPFKREAAREKVATQERHLIETKKATEVRREQLAEAKQETTEQVQQALTQLEKTIKEAKPNDPQPTLQQLAEEQKELGDLWRKTNDSNLRSALDQAAQNFGQIDPKQMEEWRQGLQRGEASALQKKLGDLREQMRRLSSLPDSAEKRALQQQLARELSDVAQAMKQLTNNPALAQALQRALEQLDLSKLPKLSKEGAEAAEKSLELSQKEIEQLIESLKDAKRLEEALKNLQQARQLAGEGKLDGAKLGGFDGLSDAANQSPGPNGTGPGGGLKQKKPEDEEPGTTFNKDKVIGQVAGGKFLMQWQTQEVGETGARTEEYREAVREVRQGVAEAIQQEQVPPGYHDTIKRYFDSLPQK